MRFFLYFVPVIFLIYAIIFLFISLKAIMGNKPSIINSKWLCLVISISFIPHIVFNIVNLIKFGWKGWDSAIFLFVPLLYVFLLIFLYVSLKGYNIYCVSDADFRNSVINSLNVNSIKFEEKMNKMELIDIDNELNISFMAWIGSGMIKIKNKKDKIIFKKIIDGIKTYFKENNVISKKIVAVFYLIFRGAFYRGKHWFCNNIVINESAFIGEEIMKRPIYR